jgi:hypothetical protein
MKELNEMDLRDVIGGVVGIDDVIMAFGILIVGGIINDWDGFKKGFMSAFH